MTVQTKIYSRFEYKEQIAKNLKEIFKTHGYIHISTPVIESLEIYAPIDDNNFKDNMYKFIDSNGEILVLRPDATIPISRTVSSNYKLQGDKLRLCYVSNVFRRQTGYYGEDREFTQAGVELFGNNSSNDDGEVISLAIKCLLKNSSNFHIEIGHVDFFKGLLQEVSLNGEIERRLKYLIENKNFIGLEKLLETLELSEHIKGVLLELPNFYGDVLDVIDMAQAMCLNKRMEDSLNNIREVYEILVDNGYENLVSVDLGLLGSLEYYTGIIFRGYIYNHGKVVLNGGRYDKLTEKYGYSIPATGFGINIDEIIKGEKDINKNIGGEYYMNYMIVYKGKYRKNAFKISDFLRDKGFIVTTDELKDNIRSYIDYATDNNIENLILCIDDRLKIVDIRQNNTFNIDEEAFLRSVDTRIIGEYFTSIH